jgi:hypothetical protein
VIQVQSRASARLPPANVRRPHASPTVRDASSQLAALQRAAGNRALARMATAAIADRREFERERRLGLSGCAQLLSREPVVMRSAVTPVAPAPTGMMVARIGWGPIGAGVGAIAFGALGYALGGGYGAAIGASVGGGVGASLGAAYRAYQYWDLHSYLGLAKFQEVHGGNSQGTLALFEGGGKHFMTEQQTNNRVKAVARGRGIEYIDQARQTGFHAEMRFVAHALANGLQMRGMKAWVSKEVCGDCADRLAADGVALQTPRNNLRYHDWVSPDTGQVVPRNPTGTYVGHRSEVDRLRDWSPRL